MWEHGFRHGKGLLKFGDGSFYRGDFKREQMHGHGVHVGASGTQYDVSCDSLVDGIFHK
jgi:hypothetical protein